MTNQEFNQSLLAYKSLKEEKTSLEEQKKKLDEQIKELQAQMDEIEANALEYIVEDGSDAISYGGMVATKFERDSVSYTSDADVIALIKSLHYDTLLRVKEELNKNALKKELKSNQQLNEAISQFVVAKKTPYVVITTEENTEKMKQHILESQQKDA